MSYCIRSVRSCLGRAFPLELQSENAKGRTERERRSCDIVGGHFVAGSVCKVLASVWGIVLFTDVRQPRSGGGNKLAQLWVNGRKHIMNTHTQATAVRMAQRAGSTCHQA